ncbi:nucleotidyl transferase AbiEii/AbiGii toxin family protein [Bradyrhizobium sp. USDA 3458]|uniref:nucleotidyl transferase AbiEii/AbiGii toxin family protein n=1 Tax=Bradyrhizobium sp. USDA 3458 TaxID=2591461 RepID=UPI001142F001|nr:nucleotidyl transferase AbiEii/AbiGii toxin family protein [Bradyrhizobium sp. USDA 3458]
MISLERLEKIATDVSFQPASIERVIRLIDVLHQIANDREIGKLLALKGGTALNLFYLALDRLSVDIDLNYVGAADREAMLRDSKIINTRLPALLQSKGYEIGRDPSGEHAGGKWRFRYISAYRRPGTLEVDVNYLFRTPFFGWERMNSAKLGDYEARNVGVVDLHEIAAGKIVALVARRASRDLYDAWRLLQSDNIDWAQVKVGALAIGAASRDLDWRTVSLKDYKYDLNDLNNKLLSVVKNGMFEAEGSPKKWCDRILAECQERLAPLFKHNDRELAFLDALYDRGSIEVDTLPVNDDVKKRIEAFPALRWKAQHVAQNLGRKPAI